jgi:hypothetical protein
MAWGLSRRSRRSGVMRVLTNTWTLSALGVAAAAMLGLRAMRRS